MLAQCVRTLIIKCITRQPHIPHTCPSEKLFVEVNKLLISY